MDFAGKLGKPAGAGQNWSGNIHRGVSLDRQKSKTI